MNSQQVFKDIQDRFWQTRDWLSRLKITSEKREKLAVKLMEAELTAWNMEQEAKKDEAAHVSKLEKQFNVNDEILERSCKQI